MQVLYYVAGVAVVYTPPADSCDGGELALGHTQRFFLGHDDDIRSLALCPAVVQVCIPVTGVSFKPFDAWPAPPQSSSRFFPGTDLSFYRCSTGCLKTSFGPGVAWSTGLAVVISMWLGIPVTRVIFFNTWSL